MVINNAGEQLLYVSLLYVFLQNLTQSASTLILGSYFAKNKYPLKSILLDVFFAFPIAFIGLIINDAVWLFSFGFIMLIFFLWRKKTTVHNYEHLTGYMISCLLNIIFVSIIGYTIRIITWTITNSFTLKTASHYGSISILISSTLEIIFSLVLMLLIKHYRSHLDMLKQLFYELHIEKYLFLAITGMFISTLSLLVVSELMSLASLIQGVLITTFSLIMLLICYQMFMLIKAYSARQEAANIRKQNSQLNNYMESIEQQYTEFKKFKHDYNNLLLSLKTLIDGNDSDQLKSYYEELKQQSIVQQTNDAQMIVATDKIDNEPVRGLLIQKFFAAQKLDIKFSIETPETAIKLTNHVVPIVRILGILLDNAIEYVHSHPQYAQAVTCAFINHEHSIELIIENPTSELIDLDQIFELGYSTKGSDHGFGLSNVSELVRQIPTLFINTELKDEKIQISLVLQKEAPFVSHLLT